MNWYHCWVTLYGFRFDTFISECTSIADCSQREGSGGTVCSSEHCYCGQKAFKVFVVWLPKGGTGWQDGARRKGQREAALNYCQTWWVGWPGPAERGNQSADGLSPKDKKKVNWQMAKWVQIEVGSKDRKSGWANLIHSKWIQLQWTK